MQNRSVSSEDGGRSFDCRRPRFKIAAPAVNLWGLQRSNAASPPTWRPPTPGWVHLLLSLSPPQTGGMLCLAGKHLVLNLIAPAGAPAFTWKLIVYYLLMARFGTCFSSVMAATFVNLWFPITPRSLKYEKWLLLLFSRHQRAKKKMSRFHICLFTEQPASCLQNAHFYFYSINSHFLIFVLFYLIFLS